ncbi:MAG: 2-C-methyl-D-erythritol 2,4-cyclodiphosphate synthase, partial [Microthrixaceae bacterium]
GSHFPDSDERWRGADSLTLLDHVVGLVADEGWVPVNVDCSVIAERPKLAPRRDEMESVLSDRVGAPVTVKGRRAEGMGALGREEGIACMASALLESAPVESAAPESASPESAPAAPGSVAEPSGSHNSGDDLTHPGVSGAGLSGREDQ